MLPLLLFVGLPIAEVILLVKAGDAFGFWWTVTWIFVSALVGIILVRQQGLAAIARAQATHDAGEVPVGAILTGVRLVFAGVFMIIPGFITDAMGLLLLLPWTGNSLGRVMVGRVRMQSTWMGGSRHSGHPAGYGADAGETINAEYEVVRPGSPPVTTDTTTDPAAKPPARRNGNPWQPRPPDGRR